MTSKARRVLVVWLALNIVVLVLYTCVPPLLFNDGAGRIAGMPPMLFWFTVLPFAVPALMAALYLYDRRAMQETAPPDPREEQNR